MKQSTAVIVITLILLLAGHVCADEQPASGSLVIVGGGLDPANSGVFLRLIDMAEKYRNRDLHALRVGIIPAGSASPAESAEYFRGTLVSYGLSPQQVAILPIALVDDRSTVDVDESKWNRGGFRETLAKDIEGYDAVWFVGGDQWRYISALCEGQPGPVLRAVWKIYRSGAVLGGTSAGAAIMSDPMIAGGESFASLSRGPCRYDPDNESEQRVSLTQGLGFFPCGMVDQHFNQRGRLGRLIVACFEAKIMHGFGVDEDTALIYNGRDNTVEVEGENGITIVDLTEAHRETSSRGPIIRNIMIHYVEKGAKYDVAREQFSIDHRLVRIDTPGQGTGYMEKPILDNVRSAITECLGAQRKTEATGIEVALKNDREASGFKVTFRRDGNTAIYGGIIDGSARWVARGLRVDIVPVTMRIESQEP